MKQADAHPIRYVAGGTVQAGDGIYVERAADSELLRNCQKGVFTYVLTSRQMGKSSLMIRAVERLLADGIRAVIVDLTELGSKTTAEQWYRGVLRKIEEQLELRTSLAAWWAEHQHIGIAQRFSGFLTDVVIPQTNGRVVIFVDEIDSTLRLDFTDDFFSSIRFLYNARAQDRRLASMSFVLLGVASPGDLIKDAQQTPFNIGERVDLDDFTEDEAAILHPDRDLVRTVMHFTSGHPYLTLRVFRSLAEDQPEIDVSSRIASLCFW
jgi:AAA-like domain